MKEVYNGAGNSTDMARVLDTHAHTHTLTRLCVMMIEDLTFVWAPSGYETVQFGAGESCPDAAPISFQFHLLHSSSP